MLRTSLSQFFALFLLLLGPAFGIADAAEPPVLSGRVVAIADGDTLTLLTTEKQQVRVRLAEIDAPEKGQPYGSRAKEALSALCFGKEVRARQVDTDRYGRTVARVFVGDLDVNAEMIRQGAAWAYRKYLTDSALLDLEAEARAAGRGLWSLPEHERIPPWEWRHPPSSEAPAVAPLALNDADSAECGAKRYCRQMSSCAEARHYLEDCGLARLDGDHDGIPCEAICGR